MKDVLILVTIGFCLFGGWLVCPAFGSDANSPAEETPRLMAADINTFGADNAPARSITIGSADPRSGFEFELELSSKGAAVKKALLGRFDNRDYKNPRPLEILSPVELPDGGEILSMANKEFVFVQRQMQLPLDKLQWGSSDVERGEGGSQAVRFEAVIKTLAGEPIMRLIKTYRIVPGSYHLDCDLTVENLSADEQKVSFNLAGPVGIGREDIRTDDRKAVGGFRESNGRVGSAGLDVKKLGKAKNAGERRLIKGDSGFLWIAVVNKYFAAILRPVPEEGKDVCGWIADKTGWFYNPDGDQRGDSGDEMIGVDLKVAPVTLAAAGQAGSVKQYPFQLYLGPKDKRLFDKSELYRRLGFEQTIDFMSCCCPASIISPLAFGILAAMEWMYRIIPNYGVVIIILVLVIRLIIHPLTKKSQVSMSKFGKLAPKIEEIKKKYANNKAEMNKQVMAFYRQEGASPIMGMLPMFVQMPIWIALYSAIYASVALRGEPFLPFWITDLSAPDAVMRFSTVTVPLFGKIQSLNLLPILMGVAFYFQQKLTPSQPSVNPQVAQQQKMMMIMMPVLFPLMLYNAPSGLNLYIMASTFAGVLEQYVIKKHISRQEEAESQGLVAATSKTGGKVKKKKPKPFFKQF